MRTLRRTRRRHPVVVGLGLLALIGLIASGCGLVSGKTFEPFNDAARGREHTEAADIVTMPDGFSNVATKCGPGGMRYTVAFHGDSGYAAIAVTPDPSCAK